MKVTEATSKPYGEGKVLYYDIRTDAGSSIGSAYHNENPFEGDEEITLEDAKKNATLWAAAPDLLEALEGILSDANSPDYEGAFSEASHLKAKEAIAKARGL